MHQSSKSQGWAVKTVLDSKARGGQLPTPAPQTAPLSCGCVPPCVMLGHRAPHRPHQCKVTPHQSHQCHTRAREGGCCMRVQAPSVRPRNTTVYLSVYTLLCQYRALCAMQICLYIIAYICNDIFRRLEKINIQFKFYTSSQIHRSFQARFMAILRHSILFTFTKCWSRITRCM